MFEFRIICFIVIAQFCWSSELYNAPRLKLIREHKIQKRQTNVQCSTDQLKCDSGCLNKTSICDGFFDCDDDTDESWETCHERKCISSRFRCKSGGCIHMNKLCDGFSSCIDSDDETLELCKNHMCPAEKFRCNYGGCIRKDRVCNGKQDCLDGSDELSTLCNKNIPTTKPVGIVTSSTITKVTTKPTTKPTTTSTESVTSSPTQCILPPITSDKSYTVSCPRPNGCGTKPGKSVLEYTPIISRCNAGYANNQDGTAASNNQFVSTCLGGSWMPEIAKCKKICDDLSSLDLNMTCSLYLHGPRVPCTSTLLEGATVIPRCKPQYHLNYRINYRHVTCKKDGTWDKEFFQCSPDCGRTPASVVDLIFNGTKEKRGEAPWNIAVYSSETSKDPTFICGGTLISAELAVSAAHCFYDMTFNKKMDARLYSVIVGKETIDYKKIDYPTTKKYSVKEIHFPDTPFNGERTNYASDIAILQLSDRIVLSDDVLPACIRWNEKDRFDPGEKVSGKLSGFGETANGTAANELQTADLPYISYAECKKRVSEDFQDSISFDKFCAGSQNGAGARIGDSGGGLVFRDEKDGFFYLRGVVSNRDPATTSSIATFTDIALYVTWIRRILSTVDRSALNDDTIINVKTKL